MLERLRKHRGEPGFTLIELLVVIVILAILAAIVIFAVGGISDKGQTSACDTDRKTLETAEEANFAEKGTYDTEANLKANGFLHEESTLHNVSLGAGNTSYTVTTANSTCTS